MSYKMFSLVAGLVALALMPAGVAGAGSLTGVQLSSLCKANMNGTGKPLESGECLGFIVGVSDTFDCLETLHGFTWNSKAHASQPQLVGIVVDWLDAHPSAQNFEAHRVVGAALSNAFPCK